MTEYAKLSNADATMVARAFPDFDLNTIPAIPEGFVCTAYHHDACPSWSKGEDDKKLQLYVAELDPTKREVPIPRYTLLVGDTRIHVLIELDEWEPVAAMARYASDLLALGGGGHPDTSARNYVKTGTGEPFFTEEEATRHDQDLNTICGVTDQYVVSAMVMHAMGGISDQEYQAMAGEPISKPKATTRPPTP